MFPIWISVMLAHVLGIPTAWLGARLLWRSRIGKTLIITSGFVWISTEFFRKRFRRKVIG